MCLLFCDQLAECFFRVHTMRAFAQVTVDLGCKKLRKFALEADAIQRLRSGLSGRMEHDSEGC